MLGKLRRRAARVKGVLVLARRVSTLGSGPLGRARVFATAMTLGARWILQRPSGRLRRLELRGLGSPRTVYLSDYGELQVLRDIVLDEEYALPAGDARTVLDLGANIGLASAWFRARYPDARVIAVEPDPETFAKLERNLGGEDGVTLVQGAVAGESGEVELFRPAGYSIASSLGSAAEPGAETARVRAWSLDDLCREHGIDELDLLKIDVEGAELDVLEGFSGLGRVRTIVGEVHPRLMGKSAEALFARLDDFVVERVDEGDETVSFVARRR